MHLLQLRLLLLSSIAHTQHTHTHTHYYDTHFYTLWIDEWKQKNGGGYGRYMNRYNVDRWGMDV